MPPLPSYSLDILPYKKFTETFSLICVWYMINYCQFETSHLFFISIAHHHYSLFLLVYLWKWPLFCCWIMFCATTEVYLVFCLKMYTSFWPPYKVRRVLMPFSVNASGVSPWKLSALRPLCVAYGGLFHTCATYFCWWSLRCYWKCLV